MSLFLSQRGGRETLPSVISSYSCNVLPWSLMMLLSVSAVLMGYTFSVKALDCDWSVVFRDCCNAVVQEQNGRAYTHMRSLFPQSDHFYVHRCLWASGCSVMMKESILKPQITFRCGLVWFHNRLLDFSIMYCPKSCCIQSRAMLLHFGKVEMLLAIIMQH